MSTAGRNFPKDACCDSSFHYCNTVVTLSVVLLIPKWMHFRSMQRLSKCASGSLTYRLMNIGCFLNERGNAPKGEAPWGGLVGWLVLELGKQHPLRLVWLLYRTIFPSFQCSATCINGISTARAGGESGTKMTRAKRWHETSRGRGKKGILHQRFPSLPLLIWLPQLEKIEEWKSILLSFRECSRGIQTCTAARVGDPHLDTALPPPPLSRHLPPFLFSF